MSKQKTYNTYRQMYPEFVYEGFQYDVQPDGLHISFTFQLDEKIIFHPSAFIPNRPFLSTSCLTKHDMDVLVFNMGMVELVSYWKCFCPPLVTVKPMRLDDEQVLFWRKLYFNGLGEFFYVNGIRATEEDFMTIRCAYDAVTSSGCGTLFADVDGGDVHIVPIGGGKDSVVTLELLSTLCPPLSDPSTPLSDRPLPLIMNPRGATVECVKTAGYTMDEVVEIRRTIDPLLLELNKQGALNGHTPFSAMLAFYTLLCSAMTGKRNSIALSNENSANESTVGGTKVNHQYSKSLEFENDFRTYVAKYISPQFNYYSFLRPLSELQIAMFFSRYEKYFDVFKSCNVGSKTDIWCGHCAKCLFAYIILSPFIHPDRLNAIFGKNMLDDVTLKLEFDQLSGQAETKPFECVGTVSEVNSALSMTVAKWYPYAESRPALLKDFREQPMVTRLDTLFLDHNLTDGEVALISHALRSPLFVFRYRELFNLLAGKEILIAGYGREGTSSHALLQSMFPNRHFDVARNNEEIVAALKAKKYDLIFKSPGIPLFFFEGLCDISSITSQSDVFLQLYGDRTVAVTGTKGKSTTTMLIYEALRYGGERDVVMAGNMGLPLFDIIPQLSDSTVIVAELSCHQLEGIHRAPHIGVLLNLFQEHLDHYHNYDEYQMAKMQIALKQHPEDVFIWCGDNEDLCHKMEQFAGKILSEKRSYSASGHDDRHCHVADSAFESSPLKGSHNRGNCRAAWLAVERMGVTPSCFQQAMSQITPLEHRMEPVGTVNGVTYYNDSISTIPQATIEAVEALQKVDTLILGGFNRGIDYKPLAAYLTQAPFGKSVHNLVLFGSAGKAMMDELESTGADLADRKFLLHYDSDYSMEEAVRFAADNSVDGGICLLSPAASSYDHYKNFEYRGSHFKECISALK